MKKQFYSPTIKIMSFILLTLSIISCGNDDNNETQNQPPEPFSLIAVTNATDANRKPTLSWNETTDPDGDEVTYEVTLSTFEGDIPIYSGLDTSFEVTEALAKNTNYAFSVTASDGNGGETLAINSIDTGNEEAFTTNTNYIMEYLGNAAFMGRTYHSAVAFQNRLWVLGGQVGGNHSNDAWSSPDGITWTQETDFSTEGRSNHSTVVVDDTMYIISGWKGAGDFFNTTLYSTDGTSWDSDEGEFDARFSHKCVVLPNTGNILLTGGQTNAVVSSETWIWNRIPGNDWLTGLPAMLENNIFGHGAVIYEDDLWIIGGFDGASYLDSVSFTSNLGVNWDNTPASLPTAVSFSATVVFDNKIWNIGGFNGSSTNNIYNYSDADGWSLFPPEHMPTEFTPRHGCTATVLDNELYIIGGYDDANYYNGVFKIY